MLNKSKKMALAYSLINDRLKQTALDTPELQ